MKKFLMFDFMLAPWMIRILYWIGQVFIILRGIAMIVMAFNTNAEYHSYQNYENNREGLFTNFIILGPLGGLLFIIAGSILLRLFFEVLMVQFKICENTNELKDILKKDKPE